jgi:tetratricopeptide (TPR) repeat protein/SAM-dependent methyltransferase
MNREDREAAERANRGARPGPAVVSPDIETLLAVALGHHNAGQLAAAEDAYRRILAVDPDHPRTLHFLGVLMHQVGRSEAAVELIAHAIDRDGRVPEFHYNLGIALESLKRLDAAAAHYSKAISLKPDYAKAYLNLANVLLGQNKLGDAEAVCRRAIALDPGWPDAPFNLGVMLVRSYRFDDAIAQFRQALRLKPDHAAAHAHLGAVFVAVGDFERAAHHCGRSLTFDRRNHQAAVHLGLSFLAKGEFKQALDLALYAFEIGDTPQARYLFSRAARQVWVTVEHSVFRELLRRALAERWDRGSYLMRPAVSVIRLNSGIRAAIEREKDASLRSLSIMDSGGPTGFAEIANDSLLRELLHTTQICDGELERVFTALRRGLLDLASDERASAVADNVLHFYCALAQQCFFNEYVYAVTDEEQGRAEALAEKLVAAVAEGRDIPSLWIAAVGAYIPLHVLTPADLLVNRAWPPPVAAVTQQQIAEPNAQRALRESLSHLTAVEDATSVAVKHQYEENPYPRWIAAAATLAPLPADLHLRARLQCPAYKPLTKPKIEILIAGCGTGQQAIETAQKFPGSDVLAVDLSTASLAYALYKTRELSVTNVRYAVADILKLDSLGRSFDLIEATGVLHHMADPLAAWRLLLSVLRPGGLMNVGLYSELGRQPILRARAFIAERGYEATADGIRQCRQDMAKQSDDPLFKALMESSDFFTVSECRDLLFHVQESRLTLRQIAAFIDEEKLILLGFDADATLLKEYGSRFPADKAQTDLASWHEFEMENPESFTGMYQFWIQKP